MDPAGTDLRADRRPGPDTDRPATDVRRSATGPCPDPRPDQSLDPCPDQWRDARPQELATDRVS